jgi:hypothetical protein
MKPLFLLLFCFYAFFVRAQSSEMGLVTGFYRSVVKVLASDSFGGRLAASADEKKAATYISEMFKQQKGVRVHRHEFQYPNTDSSMMLSSVNVYAFIDNHADSTVLIGAHYDHLGNGAYRSRSYGKKGIHPGADDNASGVAMLLGLQKRYKYWATKKYNYLFVAYSAHEPGLYGSSAFSVFCKQHVKPLCLVINFDMVGRFDNTSRILNIYGVQSLTGYKPSFDTLAFDGKLYTQDIDKIDETDARSFAEAGKRCLSFTTGIHNDYHKITDTEDLINYQGMFHIQMFIEKVLKNLP